MPTLTPPPAIDRELFDPDGFTRALSASDSKSRLDLFKQAITQASRVLNSRYNNECDIAALVCGRAWFIDQILVHAWHLFIRPDDRNISLVAVGGYGRGELHPHSDIDILILPRSSRTGKYKQAISDFLTFLWDISLEIGQSVRTPKQCRDEAKRDITVATALMESRLLTGPADLFDEMERLTRAPAIWPIKKFFKAKWDEQI
ncbi:MAG: nucleotidyltransferase domain-containing protein, partial [Pseudohongiellaceae bacterium]